MLPDFIPACVISETSVIGQHIITPCNYIANQKSPKKETQEIRKKLHIYTATISKSLNTNRCDNINAILDIIASTSVTACQKKIPL